MHKNQAGAYFSVFFNSCHHFFGGFFFNKKKESKMKTLSLILILTSIATIPNLSHARSFGGPGDVHVNGYTRKDGTYVQPHYRSAPDSVKWNNYGND
jgi:hypothetical protein